MPRSDHCSFLAGRRETGLAKEPTWRGRGNGGEGPAVRGDEVCELKGRRHCRGAMRVGVRSPRISRSGQSGREERARTRRSCPATNTWACIMRCNVRNTYSVTPHRPRDQRTGRGVKADKRDQRDGGSGLESHGVCVYVRRMRRAELQGAEEKLKWRVSLERFLPRDVWMGSSVIFSFASLLGIRRRSRFLVRVIGLGSSGFWNRHAGPTESGLRA